MDEWDWNAVGTHVNFYKGERVLSVTEAAEELNALERELAAANAKIEKALEHHAARTPHHVALERIEAALRKSED